MHLNCLHVSRRTRCIDALQGDVCICGCRHVRDGALQRKRAAALRRDKGGQHPEVLRRRCVGRRRCCHGGVFKHRTRFGGHTDGRPRLVRRSQRLLDVFLAVVALHAAHHILERSTLGRRTRRRAAVRGAPGVQRAHQENEEGRVLVRGVVAALQVERGAVLRQRRPAGAHTQVLGRVVRLGLHDQVLLGGSGETRLAAQKRASRRTATLIRTWPTRPYDRAMMSATPYSRHTASRASS